ncbi:DUF4179 domain-containing protein [Roseburia hominis]
MRRKKINSIYYGNANVSPKIPADTERRIQETYQMIRDKETYPENQVFRRRFGGKRYAIAAALMICCITLSGTALAKNVIGKTFTLLIQSVQGTKEQKEEETLYEKAGEYSQPAEAVIATAEKGSMEVTDYFCDGKCLYLFFVLNTDDESMKESDWVHDDTLEITGESAFKVNGKEVLPEENLVLRKAENGVFAGRSVIMLPDGLLSENSEDLHVDICMAGVAGYLGDEREIVTEEGQPAVLTDKKTGEFSEYFQFDFQVAVDLANNEPMKMRQVTGTISLEYVLRTPGGIYVKFSENGLSEHVAPVLYDEEGNTVTKYGSQDSLWRFAYAEGEDFVLKIQDISEGGNDAVIGEIALAIEDEGKE